MLISLSDIRLHYKLRYFLILHTHYKNTFVMEQKLTVGR